MDGNYIVIGAPNDNIGGNVNQGSAYIFYYNGSSWVFQAKLTASLGGSEDLFGSSVAISGDYVVVGAPNDDIGIYSDQGSAYVFKRTGTSWTQVANPTSSTGNDYENFGYSVAIDGDWIAIGAPGKDQGSYNKQGSVFMYLRSGANYNLHAVYTGGNQDNAGYGFSVALSSQFLVVGIPYYDEGSSRDEGLVNIRAFNGSTWINAGNIAASNKKQNTEFGYVVDISGDFILGGISTALISEERQSAYLFQYLDGNWIENEILFPSDLEMHENFGNKISIGEKFILIANSRDDIGNNSNQGSIYLYPKNLCFYLFL
jgi:hypothetical protein